jgi:hypothetical protein
LRKLLRRIKEEETEIVGKDDEVDEIDEIKMKNAIIEAHKETVSFLRELVGMFLSSSPIQQSCFFHMRQ